MYSDGSEGQSHVVLRRDLVVDVEAEVETEAELREPADRVLGDDPGQVREPVENAIEDQVGKRDLRVETSHHEALRRHVLDHVVRPATRRR